MKASSRNALMLVGAMSAGVFLYASRRPKYSGIKFKKAITINRPAGELYTFWRDFENLPRIAEMLLSVDVLNASRSRWTVSAPGGMPVRWDAVITKDVKNEMIGWRSVEGSVIETAGYVRFEHAPGQRGTIVRVALEYAVPAGRVGAAVASALGKRPGAHVEDLLRRFKQLMETGEVAVAQKMSATEAVVTNTKEKRQVS